MEIKRVPVALGLVACGLAVAFLVRCGYGSQLTSEGLKVHIRDVMLNPQTSGVVSSQLDKEMWPELRKFVSSFIDRQAKMIAPGSGPKVMLDVGKQDYQGATPFQELSGGRIRIETLDVVPSSGATYIADLSRNNRDVIPDGRFDLVLITEVIEHTPNPFLVEAELHRITKANGRVFVSVPCNFRLHGPLPDNWRITEHGLRAIFPASRWTILELTALEDASRPLFPIDYAMVLLRK